MKFFKGKARRGVILLTLLITIPGTLCMSDFASFLSTRFESEFHTKCDKYPFVQRHYDKLERPGEKYINFVYQEPGLRNGGLGDRIGGLISAAAMAIRFNRTLVLRSHNGLGDLIRPYHPKDSGDNPMYNYKNVSSWSNYNGRYENNDNTEYDLWMCINNTGQKNAVCSMLSGDVSQPYILYRSNRAYLCFYSTHLSAEHPDMKLLGINTTSDMFEAAGCLLRLVYWPTNKLWAEVGKIYGDYAKTVLKQDSNVLRRQLRGSVSKNSRKKESQKQAAFIVAATAASSPPPQRRDQNLPSMTATTKSIATDIDTTSRPVIAAASFPQPPERRMTQSIPDQDIWHANKAKHDSFFQVGIHYRCGDQSYLQHGAFDNWCVWDPNNKDSKYLSNMAIGNPSALAQCAKEVMLNHSSSNSGDQKESNSQITSSEDKFFEEMRIKFIGSESITISDFCALEVYEKNALIDKYISSYADKGKLRGLCKKLLASISNSRRMNEVSISSSESSIHENVLKKLMYVASDNAKASQTMANETGHPYALVSPQGCHVELDQTLECHTFTIATWLALAMSDVIVTQDLGLTQPTSSFSRYAGIYGLKENVFRSGKVCGTYTMPNAQMSHLQQSNWFC